MRTTLLSLLSALCLFALGTATASAEVVFDPEGPGSEPLDYHSEARLKRSYVSNEKCPVTLDEELQVRCEYLIQKKRYEADVRRSRRIDMRSRNLSERLYIREGDRSFSGATVFDPYGPGSEPLTLNREARIAQRVKNENCEKNKMIAEEFERCVYLLLKSRSERGLIHDSRRMSRQSRIKARADSRRVGRKLFVEVVEVEVEEVDDENEMEVIEFDESGPGSVPLVESVENRVNQYVNRGNCSRLNKQDMKDRCEYILNHRKHLRISDDERLRGRTSSRVSEGAVLLRRGVQRVYRGNISNTSSVIKARTLQGGFRPSPRTIREAEANFGAPVVVEGDDDRCQKISKLCAPSE